MIAKGGTCGLRGRGTNERQRLCSGAAREARCSETIAARCAVASFWIAPLRGPLQRKVASLVCRAFPELHGAPFKRNGLSAVLTRMDGAARDAWSPACSGSPPTSKRFRGRPRCSKRRDHRSTAAALGLERGSCDVLVASCSSLGRSRPATISRLRPCEGLGCLNR